MEYSLRLGGGQTFIPLSTNVLILILMEYSLRHNNTVHTKLGTPSLNPYSNGI